VETTFRLDDRTALITGGGRGIGRAVALTFAAAGAHVVVTARTAGEVEAVRAEIEQTGGAATAVVGDVTDVESVRDVAKRARNVAGRVDILVNNAGNLIYKPVVPLPEPAPNGNWTTPGPVSDEEWFTTFDTHVSGAFYLQRELVPAMLEARWGRVINITSAARARAVPFCVPYEIAKGALAAMTRSLALEWAPYNVTVNAVAPGHFHTAMSAELHENPVSRSWMMKRIPMRREGRLEEVAALARYLASDEAAFVTGQELYIDGGEML
jgi:NAD(P)-dependent dehydrogenase (short-subunit alcohol dehydrogenase family)